MNHNPLTQTRRQHNSGGIDSGTDTDTEHDTDTDTTQQTSESEVLA